MKVTLTRHTKDHQLRLSTKAVENFLERISKDDPRKTVTKFRYHLQFIGKAFIETEYMEGSLPRMIPNYLTKLLTNKSYLSIAPWYMLTWLATFPPCTTAS